MTNQLHGKGQEFFVILGSKVDVLFQQRLQFSPNRLPQYRKLVFLLNRISTELCQQLSADIHVAFFWLLNPKAIVQPVFAM